MKLRSGVAGLAAFLFAVTAYAQEDLPADWLQRMAQSVQATSYAGTVIRIQNGSSEALKVVHTVTDGVVREKVVVQEGNGMEIIRNGNEVHCILPDRQSVLVEEWDDQSTLFSTLPSSDIRFGSEYDVAIVRQERVAGRKAVMIAIRPHDDFRYGHRIWLDKETAFPLQTKLIGQDGSPIEQVKFADIQLGQQIAMEQLQPSMNIENFRWFSQPKPTSTTLTDAAWGSDALPPGFQITSVHAEQDANSGANSIHMMISDGLANVSVFIEPGSADTAAPRSDQAGAANSFSLSSAGHRVTAVGEVPLSAVEHIARSMRPN